MTRRASGNAGELTPPARVLAGKYEVEKKLAHGGMGELLLARQTGAQGFERPVILKRLLPGTSVSEGAVQEFLDEARIAATLNHPHVVSIYEAGQWADGWFIAMEYIPGLDLAQLLASREQVGNPLPLPVVVKIIHDAALGLDHAHRAVDMRGRPLNIVHRDVSPQNVMVREDGLVKVVDFGIARSAGRSQATNPGVVKGKAAFMSPEQARGHKVDARSDQFSLGVVFWQAVTRQRLFTGEGDFEVMRRIARGEVRGPETAGVHLPEPVRAVLMRMLQRQPADRFPSCLDVAQALEPWLRDAGPQSSQTALAQVVGTRALPVIEVATVEHLAARTANERPPTPTPGLGPAFIAACAAVGVLVGLMAAFWPGPRGPPETAPARAPQSAPASAAPTPAPLAPPHSTAPLVTEPEGRGGGAAAKPKPLPPPKPGQLSVVTEPWTLVEVDGRSLGSTPLYQAAVSSGAHQLVLTNEQAGVREERKIQISAGQVLKLDLKLTPQGPSP